MTDSNKNNVSLENIIEDVAVVSAPVILDADTDGLFTAIPDEEIRELQAVARPIDPVGTFECKICNLFSGDLANLYAHVLSNHAENWKTFTGKDCTLI